jgi:hypothetical protein
MISIAALDAFWLNMPDEVDEANLRFSRIIKALLKSITAVDSLCLNLPKEVGCL